MTDKGYHSNEVLRDLAKMGIRSYASEPDRGRRRGRAKRPSATRCTPTGGGSEVSGASGCSGNAASSSSVPSRTGTRPTGCGARTCAGHEKILKRILIHAAACNLSLLMRRRFGVGTPRALQGLAALIGWALAAVLNLLGRGQPAPAELRPALPLRRGDLVTRVLTREKGASSTGC